jgi:general secretion pathway protein H
VPRRLSRHPRGFSLLELLVVIVILSVIAATAVLSIGTLGSDERIDREARRLAALLQLAAEEALFQGRDLGLYVEEDRYQFLAYSRDSRLWTTTTGDRSFRERAMPEGLVLSLVVEDQDIELRTIDDVEEIQPQVAIFSSGEMTPFELYIEREFSDVRYAIFGEADGTIELIAGDDSDG